MRLFDVSDELRSVFSLRGRPGIDRPPVLLAFGGGVNSVALCIGLMQRNLSPDAILFADTGGEKPETYAYLSYFDEWLSVHGWPLITVVRNDGKYESLEANALATKTLPSIAYGYRACSEKYKQRPQHKWAKAWEPARRWWGLNAANRRAKNDNRVLKLLGYDADESHRPRIEGDDFYDYLYPLRSWDWGRAKCIEAIIDQGLIPPPKSACFFCPSSKNHEIEELARYHPDLMRRALVMERTAMDASTESGKLGTIKGLGRCFNWGEFLEKRKIGLPVLNTTNIACTCLSEVIEGDGIDSEEEDPA